jgi:hypothetical protein
MFMITRAVVAVACIALLSGCGGKGSDAPSAPTTPSTTSAPPAPAVPPGDVPAALQRLATKAIYFGHQSVGFNMMDGVQALIGTVPGATLRVEQTSNPSAVQKGVFAHAINGSNGDPIGKGAAFQNTMQGGMAARVDIAFFKFCYVDFWATTNVAAVFADYRSKMNALKAAYPQVRFVHVTAPLTTGSSVDNAVREQFNDLVRQTFGGTDAVFDLAKVESTRPDGTSELFSGVRALVGAYSSDGGHLNATGAEVVAKALVTYLASL